MPILDDEDNGSNYYFSLPVDFGRRSLDGTEDDSLEYSGSGDDLTLLIGEEISISSNATPTNDETH